MRTQIPHRASIVHSSASEVWRRQKARSRRADASHDVQIVLGRLLGKGMFGQTYLGCWRGGDLAVKCVRVSKESEAASFLREVAALAALRHPNVMQFYGMFLVMLYS